MRRQTENKKDSERQRVHSKTDDDHMPRKECVCLVTAVSFRTEKPLLQFSPGAGIMEADDRQVTTVFTGQPSFHHRHSTKRVS